MKRQILGVVLVIAMSAAGSAPAAEPPERWFGEWLVARDLGTTPIAAMSDAEAARAIGGAVVLAPDRSRFGEEACDAPTYRTADVSGAEFLDAFRLAPSQMALPPEGLAALHIGCRGSPFRTVYRLGAGCVFYVFDGRFFALSRGASVEAETCPAVK